LSKSELSSSSNSLSKLSLWLINFERFAGSLKSVGLSFIVDSYNLSIGELGLKDGELNESLKCGRCLCIAVVEQNCLFVEIL
jgi:hypothetical protein